MKASLATSSDMTNLNTTLNQQWQLKKKNINLQTTSDEEGVGIVMGHLV